MSDPVNRALEHRLDPKVDDDVSMDCFDPTTEDCEGEALRWARQICSLRGRC